MSRIGNKPIPLPSGVKIAMSRGKIDVQGPKGKMTLAFRTASPLSKKMAC